jgi:prevent-host-death family protein
MDISVTELKQRCLELVREVEATGRPVAITRRGRVVAQLEPALAGPAAGRGKPWERMRGRGRWLAAPGETFVRKKDLKGL